MRYSLLGLLAITACVSRPIVTPAGGGAFALASENGVSLVADARAWDGSPSDLQDYAVPIGIEVHNGSLKAVVFRLDGVAITDQTGRQFPAWQIAGRKDTPPPQTNVQPELAPPPQPQPQPSPPPPPSAPPPSSAPVQPTKRVSPYETILWSPDDGHGDVTFARGAAPSHSYGGGFGGGHSFSAPSRSYGGAPARSYGGAPSRSYYSPRAYAPPSGYYSQPRVSVRPYATYAPYPRYYTSPHGYYPNYYRPYWYNSPGFSPYWGGWGPGWGWGWGYTVYMGPGAYWGGSLPPERTDIVRLGLVDGTLQPGADVRGFVYFNALPSDVQSIQLHIPIYDAQTNNVVANLQTTFNVTP